MKQGYLVIPAILILLLTGCGSEKQDMPTPSQLMVVINERVELPDMIDVGTEYLESLTGISSDTYDDAVCYMLTEGTAPDEIIIIQANDEVNAQAIQYQLEDRLAYKIKSVEQYFIEYQPEVKAGVVHRDGLIVSLIVSNQVSEIIQVFEDYQ